MGAGSAAGGNLFTESVGLLARSLVDGQCRKLSCLDLSNSARAPAGALAELLGALRGHGRRPIEVREAGLVVSMCACRGGGGAGGPDYPPGTHSSVCTVHI